MSRLVLVRHGQASAFSDDYDRLSPLGEAQARALGGHWVKQGYSWDRLFFGPRLRHRQTAEAVAEVYRERGRPLPHPEMLPDVDEHRGASVVKRVLSEAADDGQTFPPGWREAAKNDPELMRHYFELFQKITLQWVLGQHVFEDLEPWPAFRRRVEGALGHIVSNGKSSQNIVIFTSGGPLAVATGYALALPDEKIIELSWAVFNIAVAEFQFSRDRFSLFGFNGLPPMEGPDWKTLV